ncbi:Y-family DNA polymerase [Microvirga arsenatis]|uniref:DNA-directed DNA polymerase n=1 Tax=Microvirga arsenatis TaxID=2692265 RepID=A0ABW9Z494_9HYPH|nr:type VI secretion protein ImpB [Microvirga arsenatis]NBJ12722.1 type VI secretion protein ImpB [Microvirga arsenatis]NBJ26530.1 type VI secretion protein ImpB [Microvirga arsenatis]
MRKPTGLERLYVDFDSFFASAEQHLQPHLRGRPVGIIPVDSEHTGLIAVSREAKALGLKRGTFVRDARRQCPGLVLVTARHEVYVDLHKTIIAAIETVLPVKAVCSIDEMLCALLPSESAQGLALGRRVKEAVASRIGPTLTCSVGLGPNDLLAKIAAEMHKPDGLVALHPDDLPGPLLSLELTDVPGIARGNAARLARAGIGDMAALWRVQPKELRRLWGSVEGERLWMGLHGYTVERPETRRRMFGHGRVLPADWRSLGGAYAAARVLLAKASRRMRRAGFAAKALALWLTNRNSAGWYGEEHFQPTWDDPSLLASLSRLFLHAEREEMHSSRSVHVALHDLVPLQEIEDDLFDAAPEAQLKRRMEYLSAIADQLNVSYRKTLLHWGPWVTIPGGYAGAKIAFNRIPDAEDF